MRRDERESSERGLPDPLDAAESSRELEVVTEWEGRGGLIPTACLVPLAEAEIPRWIAIINLHRDLRIPHREWRATCSPGINEL